MQRGRAIRVGVPWRTAAEEAAGKRDAYQKYLDCVRAAGGEAVELSLRLGRERLAEVARSLDALVLPGSPADVDPQWYHAPRHPHTAESDPQREQTDFTLYDHAFAERKPLLAICYGAQSLNVWLGGTLVQDIASELDTDIQHEWSKKSGEPEPHHKIRIAPETELGRLAGARELMVNSSHHQSIQRWGRGLRIGAQSPDAVIEAVELAEAGHWVMGVQWHPERAPHDELTKALFGALVGAGRKVAV
jgi:putative glutamine amidotransferase